MKSIVAGVALLFLGLCAMSVADDPPSKNKSPAFSKSDLQETIKWIDALNKKVELARRNSIAAKNGFELGKVQEQVEKEFKSIVGESTRWQAQVKVVETKQVQMITEYFAGKQSIRVEYDDLMISDFAGVKPGEWVWITGKISEAVIFNRGDNERPIIRVKAIKVEQIEKRKKK